MYFAPAKCSIGRPQQAAILLTDAWRRVALQEKLRCNILIDVIREHWGWTGIDPVELIGKNAFGNLLIKDRGGAIWFLRPEELACEIIAESHEDLAQIFEDPSFLMDWEMAELVDVARAKLGSLDPGHVYYLVTPAELGGLYEADNFEAAPLEELIYFSGTLAFHIKDVPEGGEVEMSIVDGNLHIELPKDVH
jgi:hypothetical protein